MEAPESVTVSWLGHTFEVELEPVVNHALVAEGRLPGVPVDLLFYRRDDGGHFWGAAVDPPSAIGAFLDAPGRLVCYGDSAEEALRALGAVVHDTHAWLARLETGLTEAGSPSSLSKATG